MPKTAPEALWCGIFSLDRLDQIFGIAVERTGQHHQVLITYVPILFTGSPTFGTSGSNLILLAMGQGSIKLYSYIISVGITAFIHVKSQKYTGNVWAGVLINTLIICMITVANCNSITAF